MGVLLEPETTRYSNLGASGQGHSSTAGGVVLFLRIGLGKLDAGVTCIVSAASQALLGPTFTASCCNSDRPWYMA